jgi:hypothetical protein
MESLTDGSIKHAISTIENNFGKWLDEDRLPEKIFLFHHDKDNFHMPSASDRMSSFSLFLNFHRLLFLLRFVNSNLLNL